MKAGTGRTLILLIAIALLLSGGAWLAQALLSPAMDPAEGRFTIVEPAQACMLSEQGCTAMIGDDLHVMVRVPDRILPLENFELILEADAPINALEVSYIMPHMDMGMNRFPLVQEGETWRAVSALPMCMSGRLDWLAKVRLEYRGQGYEVQMPLTLHAP